MRDIRRSWHCRRLFFRYLRQRDKAKEAEKQLYQSKQSKPTEKSNLQFDKFNTAISTTIVVTIFFGIISIFIHYYAVIVLFSALLLEILIAIIGAIHYGNKERKEADEATSTTNEDAAMTEADLQKLPTLRSSAEEQEIAPFCNTAKEEPPIVLESFDMMTGVQFKGLIEKHFQARSYTVKKICPRINSIDFLIEKEGKTIAIATKRTFDLIQRSYISNVIESAKMYENISSIMIITSSMYFIPQARQLAQENGIILWDREILKSQLGGLK